ncbi:MAG: trans-sulfuration enzyme family protein [Ilumatobacteraceae bacterium]
MRDATTAVVAGRPSGAGDPLNAPIVLASNFRASELYGRVDGTPTWQAFEEAYGALEGGRAISFATGMAAASAVLFAVDPRVVVMPVYSYAGVRSLVRELEARGRLEVRWVDITDTAAVIDASAGADLVWLESPTNPTLDVADIPAVAAAVRGHATVVVDGTFATPIVQRPLADGAHIVMHSATKFIGGHSDLMMGVVAVANDDDARLQRLVDARWMNGGTPGALEAFLALRGLRTLPLRMERAQANAAVLVGRLSAHAAVESVRYPGSGAMVSFVMRGGAAAADAACAAVRLVVPATSLGGVETSMERRQKYAGDAHVPPGLIRMSCGIEDVDDVWADLEQALTLAGRA